MENVFLKTLLLPNEDVLWVGEPKGGVVFSSYDILLIPFSIVWTSVPAFMLYSILSNYRMANGISIFFVSFVSVFLLIGLYLLAGRFLLDIYRRKHTRYVVTNRRILILGGIRKNKVKSIDIRNCSSIELSAKQNGFGTISFGKLAEGNSFYRNPFPFGNHLPSFEGIESSIEVYKIIMSIQQKL